MFFTHDHPILMIAMVHGGDDCRAATEHVGGVVTEGHDVEPYNDTANRVDMVTTAPMTTMTLLLRLLPRMCRPRTPRKDGDRFR